MPTLRKFFATSGHPAARAVRGLRRRVLGFTLPAPAVVVKPLLAAFLAARTVYHFAARVLFCEPLFKAYCKQYGRGVRTGPFLHWVQGSGDIILGDDVVLDGKCTIQFASRFADRPTLRVGDGTYIGHGGHFTVADGVSIGRDCLIASGVWMTDSDGHPTDPTDRRAGSPPPRERVRPIRVGDNVWVGRDALILPGVTVGDHAVIAARSVVVRDVPACVVVAGNPAKQVAELTPPHDPAEAPA